MKVKSESEVTKSYPTPSDPMDCMQPTRLLRPWDFPGKSTGVGCHYLLRRLRLGLFLGECCAQDHIGRAVGSEVYPG